MLAETFKKPISSEKIESSKEGEGHPDKDLPSLDLEMSFNDMVVASIHSKLE